MNNKDKFGFYQVGNDTFYSRVEAVEYSKRSNQSIHWNFNDHVFGQFDWKTEPPVPLEQLYAERARQIREQYDYIVIWYSGGADSHNVLSSFVKNNIPVDEIAQFVNYEGSGTWDSYLNEEVAKVAIPESKRLQEQYPHIKHRLVDLTPIIKNLYKIDNNQSDFIYKANRVFSPNQLSRTYLREQIKDYADIIDSGKSLCFVWGSEKPSIRTIDGQRCVYFADLIDNAVGVRTQQLNRSWEHDELFYWTPDMPEIVCKQAHIIKRFLDSVNQSTVDDYVAKGYVKKIDNINKGRLRGEILIGTDEYTLDVQFMHTLIYPWWDPATFSNGKNPSGIFSHRDLWWFLDKNEKDRQLFKYAIEKLKTTVGKENLLFADQNPTDIKAADLNPMHLNVAPLLSCLYPIE